jgi:murein DD-endopeptidase MepM/ murein hydrolase activator NlpD
VPLPTTPPAGGYQPPSRALREGPGAGKPVETQNPLVRFPPTDVVPKLSAGRYVFPVYGPSAFTDTFGAFRGDVPGNWHHGDDIFAPLGAPLLSVADGTVFSVGWNKVGGNRLWLRDNQGNEFYYAHLSAFSTLAYDGAHVRAGDVIGFVGNTGDAEGTPYHVHFEVHPLAFLGLGYDGAVNPTKYLQAWEHARDVRFPVGSGWAPPASRASDAPQPGAILLQSHDISSASGLVPASLRRTLEAPPEGGAMAPAAAASAAR